ncbi:MAG TPA: glycosyltransferase family 4 protein [Vicinamibacterales bacterium]|jgi:glycosyltransferase involved in cell wall biosynthesis|nr:glycosyltransferase family 4 protein [Vicinamibacterales bacterium]
MRILFLCEGDAESWDSWSGISKSIVDFIRAAGHDVRVANVDVCGPDRWVAAASTFAPVRRRWATRYHLGAVPFWLRSRRASRHIGAHCGQIDAIVQIGSTFEPSGRGGIPYFVCSDSNIRVAQQGASSGYSDATPLTPAELEGIGRREARVYRGASALFPLSERLRRSFIEDFGIPPDRIKAIYAGPNFDVARVPAPSPRHGEHPPTVLFVGRQYHRKGGDVLLESFRRLRKWLPEARLLIAGLPPRYVDALGVTCLGDLDKGTDAGWQALLDAYTSANVFALPTRFEPFGIAFVEAMHFGLPCIGPQAWAVPEIIADGETGFTVPVDDVERLTDRLLELLTQPDMARRMGEAGRRRAHELFTWPRVVSRMLDIMAPVVEARRDARISTPLVSAALPQ